MKNIISISLLFWFTSSLYGQSLPNLREAEPFKVSGTIGGNLGFYSVNGIAERTSPFQYGLTARLNFSIYDFNIPVYAALRDHSFNYGGSFSRIRINPQYKWIKLHIGDAFMNFNPYTLSGRTVNGMGVELTPGLFRFKAIYGRIEDLRSFQDSLQLGTTFMPTYSRKTFGASVGFGNARSYVDAYAVRTWDNLDSLNGEALLEDFTRQSNTVLGASASTRISNRISIRSNAGISLFTDNLDSYGTNTIVGENPITGNLAEANFSSNVSYAGDIGINYNGQYFSLNGKVRYIQPYYQPLSVAYLNTDILNYTVGTSFGLFKNKLLFNGSVGVQSTNLSGNKLNTANHLIINANTVFRISQSLSGTFNYSNFIQDFQAKLIQIDDLYTYAVTNSIMSGSISHNMAIGNMRLATSIRGGSNNFLTVDESEEELSAYQSYFTSFSMSLGNPDQDWRITSGLNYRIYDRDLDASANYGLNLNMQKGLLDKKIRINVRSSFNYIDRNEQREGTTFRNGVSSSFKVNKVSNIALRLDHIRRTSVIRTNFSETRSALQYMYKF